MYILFPANFSFRIQSKTMSEEMTFVLKILHLNKSTQFILKSLKFEQSLNFFLNIIIFHFDSVYF